MQAEAYHAEMSGAEAMERQQFDRAARQFSAAQLLYRALSTAAGGDIGRVSAERAEAQSDQIRLSHYFRQQHKHAQQQQDGVQVEDDDDDGDDVTSNRQKGQQDQKGDGETSLESYTDTLERERTSRIGDRVDSVLWLGELVAVGSDRLSSLLSRARTTEADVSADGCGSVQHWTALSALYIEATTVIKEEAVEAKLEAHKTNLDQLLNYCHTQSAAHWQPH